MAQASPDHNIVGELRNSFGKGAARKLRAAGKTPAVIYGHGSEPRHITMPAHEIALILRTKNAILNLDIEGKTETVLVKAVQRDAVLQIVEHIDLVEIVKGEKVHVEVPVHIVGESLSGTTVELEHHSVRLIADAINIPTYVEIHLNKEGAGHHVLASDIKLPAGVSLDLPADALIASVLATAAGHSEELAAAAAE
jgi:large subunit ribosomal protein L25